MKKIILNQKSYLLYDEMKVVPEEVSVLITEEPLSTKENRAKLSEILFERLELPHGKKGKTGYSTSAEVLEKLIDSNKDAVYQKKLKANNAVDFDDIINFTIKLLLDSPDLLEYYSDNKVETIYNIEMSDILKERVWDYVSLQQVSHDSGIYSTYKNLKKYQSYKKAKFIYFPYTVISR